MGRRKVDSSVEISTKGRPPSYREAREQAERNRAAATRVGNAILHAAPSLDDLVRMGHKVETSRTAVLRAVRLQAAQALPKCVQYLAGVVSGSDPDDKASHADRIAAAKLLAAMAGATTAGQQPEQDDKPLAEMTLAELEARAMQLSQAVERAASALPVVSEPGAARPSDQ